MKYDNKEVFIGIDVHKKTYTFSALCEGVWVKTATVPANPEQFTESLKKWFGGAKLRSVYEAGFSGFKLHRLLKAENIENIVINPASLAVAAKDKVKTDKRDSKKLAEQLSQRALKGIYVPSEQEESARLLTRTREQVLRERVRIGNILKGRLHCFGLIKFDDTKRMSEKYIREIESLGLNSDLEYALKILIDQWRFLAKQLVDIEVEMKAQSFEDSYNEAIYQSVPGVGELSARLLSNELGDLSKRFSNQKALFQFVGLTPTEDSSGEREHRGNIDRQGSGRIRKVLVECAWRSITQDEVLREGFERIASRRGKKRAIVATARRLLGRMRACFVYKNEYCLGLVE